MKKITLFTLALLCMVQLYAEESVRVETEQYIVSPIKENWTISVGAGAEFHPHKELITNPSLEVPTFFQFDMSVSKWINPYVGLRIKYSYSPFDITSTSSMNLFVQVGETSASGSMSFLHGDIIFNLSAVLAGYDEDRIYSFKPYLGMGFASVRASDNVAREYLPTAGIINEFKLSQSLSLHVDLGLIAPNAGVYGESGGNPRFFTTSATVGLTYNFGKDKARTFRTVTSSDNYLTLSSQNESLSSEISDIKSENASLARDKDALKKDLETIKEQKANDVAVAPKSEPKTAPVAVFFEINESRVTKADIARLKYVAEMLKEQSDVQFVIEGYADSATGNVKFNTELSQKRADAICKVLVDNYGVSSSQVEAIGKGGVNYLFEDATLNRAAIIKNK